MGLAFTQAELVAPGDKILNSQMRRLVRAFNDRDRSGIGDTADRRLRWYYNLWRQVRNSGDGGFVFPAEGEFFDLYQLLDPENNASQWPVTGPGEPEGANVANPMMQAVFGLEDSLSPEPARIGEGEGIPFWLGTDPPATLEEWWELGKSQRGVIDTQSGLQNVPALVAAQSFFAVTSPYFSPLGKSYGGYFPTPVMSDEPGDPGNPNTDCGNGNPDDPGFHVPSFIIKFTAQGSDVSTAGLHGAIGTDSDPDSATFGNPVCSYAGSCPMDSADTGAGHVWAIARLPFATYVAVADGSGGYNVDRFTTKDWVEGPYEGEGVLQRAPGHQLERAFWAFIADFRGTVAQRAKRDFEIERIAFDFQGFFERQYYLAPAAGHREGDFLVPDYPRCTFTPGAAAPHVLDVGTLAAFPAGDSYAFRAGYVFAGVFAKASGLKAPVVIQVLDGTEIRRFTLEPNEDGIAEEMFWFRKDRTPAALQFKLLTQAEFLDGSGQIWIESAELYAYKPEFWDAYLVLRSSASKGGDATTQGVDGRGIDTDFSRTIWQNYTRKGCIVNTGTASVRPQADWVTDNPIFDAGRRLSRDHMRILARRQFFDYAVTGGKSILRFKRYAYGLEGQKADCFFGIAPSYKPVQTGEIVRDEKYIVRGASGGITYDGATFGPGQTFLGRTKTKFEASGDALLYIYDGIRSQARERGFTNEWLMFIGTHVYHPSESSIWKPEAYADFFTWNQRCHYQSGSINNNTLQRHINFTERVEVTEREDETGFNKGLTGPRVQASFISPEAPSGYNFAQNANNGASADFYRSCQIYTAPYELESATIEFEGADELVRLVFKQRFSADASAPATVDKDPLACSEDEVEDLRSEPYRTDDNALREYARHRTDGAYQASWKTGDAGVGSSIQSQPDNPFGSVYPHFFFSKLVPEPFNDDNDFVNSHDARCTIDAFLQMEIALAAACEGFVDGKTSMEITCKTGQGSLYDFTYQNLCLQAFGLRNISAFSLEARPDRPSGFGPLPNTFMYAEVFNRLASAVNLLTQARVMLPFSIECRSATYEAYRALGSGAVWPPGTTCSGGAAKVVWTGQPPDPDQILTPFTDWDDCGITVAASASGYISPNCDGSAFQIYSVKNVTEFRVTISENALLAIPELWRDSVQSLGGFLGVLTIGKDRACLKPAASSADAEECRQTGDPPDTFPLWDGGSSTGYKATCSAEETTVQDTEECLMLSAGVLDAGTPVHGDFYLQRRPDTFTCYNVSQTGLNFEVFTDPGFFVTIPLVALP